jgi:hypothetical protein
MEGIEFGTFATAAKSTKGPAAKSTKIPATKSTKGPVGGKGGKAASPTTSKPTACKAFGTVCTQDYECCNQLFCANSALGKICV